MTNGNLSAKVSEKGAVSVYGLRRFPITFYASEWEALFSHADKIKKFIKANAKELKDKADNSGGPKGTTAL
jgi:hypothetical protein